MLMKIILDMIFMLSCVSTSQDLDKLINDINTKQNLWTAGRNFHNASLSELNGLLGTGNLSNSIFYSIPTIEHLIEDNIPKTFDARTHWPGCESIQKIGDQSACGSGWAVAACSVISDRICIHSNASLTPEVSAKHLMTCEDHSSGCNGGYLYYAFKFWKDQGVVTGGNFGSRIGCQTYPFAPCEHVEGSKSACPKEYYKAPECVSKCEDPALEFNKQRHYGLSVYTIRSQRNIQPEIMKNGPITAQISVYEDFFFYKSGVYVQTAGNIKGEHSVKIMGWGEENGTPYWLVTNSWNEDWGEKGLVKIRRGTNECGIETLLYTGLPDINK